MEPVYPPSSPGCAPISRSAAERVGRDGALRLGFERRSGRTILTERRFALPFQVLEPIALDGGSVYLMLLNPTGGLVGGDRLRAEIVLNAGSHVCLTTPSATKVYRALGAASVQETTIRIGENAVLEYFPDHVIPFPGSVFHQSLKIDMAPASCALVYDAFAVGRAARSERWLFREFVNRITVGLQGRPVFIDRAELSPARGQLAGLGGAEGFNYIATFGLFAENFRGFEALAEALKKELEEFLSIKSGVSLLSRGGCVVRILAPSAPLLGDAFHCIWSQARRALLGAAPFELRK